jgi:hypothetical protein
METLNVETPPHRSLSLDEMAQLSFVPPAIEPISFNTAEKASENMSEDVGNVNTVSVEPTFEVKTSEEVKPKAVETGLLPTPPVAPAPEQPATSGWVDSGWQGKEKEFLKTDFDNPYEEWWWKHHGSDNIKLE